MTDGKNDMILITVHVFIINMLLSLVSKEKLKRSLQFIVI